MESKKRRKPHPLYLVTKVCPTFFSSFRHSDRRRVSRDNGVQTKYDRMFERRNQGILSENYSKMMKLLRLTNRNLRSLQTTIATRKTYPNISSKSAEPNGP